MTTQTIETVKLRNGITVLAKNDKRFGMHAVKYQNLTQATKAQIKLQHSGIDCTVCQMNNFYIRIK
jgi:hypothetical protein